MLSFSSSRLLALTFVLVVLAASCLPAQELPLPGPALDSVPGPSLTTVGLPAPATWPLPRYSQPLRMLALTSKSSADTVYQRLARRLRASLDVRYLSGWNGGDDIYHVNDKWIEPQGNPTREELAAYTRKVALDTLTAAAAPHPLSSLPAGEGVYDVVFWDVSHLLKEADYQKAFLALLNAGTVVVVDGSFYPAADSPLAGVWPAQPSKRGNSWMSGGAQRADGPELAGLPLERLAGHTWIPLAEATEGSTALATGEAGALFLRRVGKGALLFCPTGPISRKWDAMTAFGRLYDHDEIWLRLWDQALHTVLRGTEAIPAYADLRPGGKEAPPGADYVLPGKLVNRAWPGPLAVSVHVTTPRGKVVYTKEETVTLAAGQEQAYEVRVPVAASWPAGLYPVYLTVGDAKGKRQFQQALEYIPVTGSLNLVLAADRRGYLRGEKASFDLTASSQTPWKGNLAFGVYDFRGRLLASEVKAVSLTEQPQDFAFSFALPDQGVRDYVYWAEVAAVQGQEEWGRAEARFYDYDRWSMRNEMQWSTWAGIACAPPSLVLPGMNLMAFAGMNALGYPGRSELYYAAERYGWHYYNEGVGMNTFAPVIEYENAAEIEAELLKEAKGQENWPDMTTAAFVLASVGEEAGFKNGWGTRYYWDTPVAPDKAARALQWYLKTRYPSLADLNAAWKTNYQSWDEVKLTKEFSGNPPALAADGWAHPKDSPLGAGVTGVSLAPYQDTADFYNWYYDQFITIARKILREKINPVALTMSSAPTIGSADYDVRLTGPGAWNESQMWSLNTGPEPGFGLIWGHFDWSVMTENMFWGFLLTRSGHNNYWVDMPLMLNNDLSLTRSTMAMRRWTRALAGHERVILDSREFKSDVGILEPNGVGRSIARTNMTYSVKVALQQGGFGFAVADPAKLAGYKAVIALGRQALSAQEAEQLNTYVEGGGTLLFTDRFGTQTELGTASPTSPGQGLAEKWGLTLPGPFAPIPQYGPNQSDTFPLDGVDPALAGLKMQGYTIFREKVVAPQWKQLAAYPDGTPALLMRSLGKGRLIYLNAVYQSHWYIQWVTPTGPERQGFYRFLEWVATQAGARRTLRLDGDPREYLHMAIQQFTDPTGKISYAIVRTNGEVPWTAGNLTWLGPETTAYDILGGGVDQPAPVLGKQIAINLRPGQGRLLAFTAAPVKAIRLSASPARITAGSPIKLTVQILDAAANPVPGSFPLELRATLGGTALPGLARSFSAESGGSYTLNTALSDPAGKWALTLTDGITGLTGTALVEVAASPLVAQAPGYVAWGWPSEIEEPQQLTADEFVGRLKQLADLYRRDLSGENWMTKQYLGYYYDYFPGTRHDLLRPLNEVDWVAYAPALRQAVTGGERLILIGEDLGIDPATGLGTWPSGYRKQVEAVLTALAGAKWSVATRDGDTVVARLGAGQVILSRESPDAAGNTNPELARWQQRWLGELEAVRSQPDLGGAIPAPDAARLARWWRGAEPIISGPRTVTWFQGNLRAVNLNVDPAQLLGPTFALVLPPTGQIKRLEFSVAADPADAKLTLDVGCDDTFDLEVTKAQTADLAEAARKWLEWRAATSQGVVRDEQAWRVVPVRVTAAAKAAVTVKDVTVVVQ
jgi:hypothetical protein